MKLNRSAGVLLHITSLPSPFGIGDLGPEAIVFADFLKHSNQTYWQILPLNPTEEGQGNSPYSAISSRAGNTLLISPELLADEGFLDKEELQQYHLPKAKKVDYKTATKIKNTLFDKAWQTFQTGKTKQQQEEFAQYCTKESAWLNDFALYCFLKEKNEGKPWSEWDACCKDRDEKTLKKIETDNGDNIQKIKWLQYIFAKQWRKLKEYCNQNGILFFGDLPFYASYDSADVWSHRELFSLDKDGAITGVAGVPPDAFSANGQLWGMPVYQWNIHKKTGYRWWIERLRKNMEHFDLLRLDHFRAFADYWEVPAGEKTAIKGEWKQGPRSALFDAVKKELGDLPFIAEDLGAIDQPVYDLRDQFHFAGMKILQFAFGDAMPDSSYIPHNYSNNNFIVYTGTHDNNTVKGWYRNEGRAYHDQLNRYTGQHLDENNIHIVLSRMAYSSVADVAILPAQDLLGLDESCRMNIPASEVENWAWQLLPGQLEKYIEDMLNDWTWLYKRGRQTAAIADES